MGGWLVYSSNVCHVCQCHCQCDNVTHCDIGLMDFRFKSCSPPTSTIQHDNEYFHCHFTGATLISAGY